MKNRDFSFYLSNFLTSYLPGQKGLKTNTILSYRDAFVLFLRFCRDSKKIPIEKLSFKHINQALMVEYLIWLETKNGASVASRNQRLTAIRSFFKYVQSEAPEHLALCQSILAIENKKHKKPVVNFLGKQGVRTLLKQPDTTTLRGRRDLLLLEVLYDSAARVQELCDLKVRDVRLDAPPTIRLTGKGGKTRIVPLSVSVASLLHQYISETSMDTPTAQDYPLFANRSNQPLTRGGVGYILQKHAGSARSELPDEIPDKLTPHCLRHSKAMHLLQSGINLIYIRDFLGHESIETTQIYAKADPELKRKALVATLDEEAPIAMPSWSDSPDLMKRLMALGKH
jgi:site-specific recombinase XerD